MWWNATLSGYFLESLIDGKIECCHLQFLLKNDLVRNISTEQTCQASSCFHQTEQNNAFFDGNSHFSLIKWTVNDARNMIPSPGLSRRVLLVFLTGIGTGFFFTYILFTSFSTSQHLIRGAKRTLVPHESFLPDSPHSHGETDGFVGPEHAQKWSDEHSESHHHNGKPVLQYYYLDSNKIIIIMTQLLMLQIPQTLTL